jgi:hypothetical protein
MYSVDFCDACIEGLWQSVLRPLSLVDNITQVASCRGTNVTLELLPVAEFRDVPRETEAYTITWSVDGQVLGEWANQTSALISHNTSAVEVDVKLWTAQVRVDTGGVLQESVTIDIEK